MIDLEVLEAWFKDFADRNLLMVAVGNESRFAHNIDELRTGLQSRIPCIRPTLVLDDPTGRADYNGALSGITSFGFWILKKVAKQDYANENTVAQECNVIAKKLIAKMQYEHDSGDYTSVMAWANMDTISYEKAGPEVDNLFGVYYGFTFTTQDFDEYDEDDYIPIPEP